MSTNDVLQKHLASFAQVCINVPAIRYAGDEVLRHKTKHVSYSVGFKTAHALQKVLMQYRAITGYGRGLAAPQIGLSQSVFVTFEQESFHTFINPNIISTSQKRNRYRELCISSGIVTAEVLRWEEIVLEWVDENGLMQQKEFGGIQARLYQHEYAHLQGELNIDVAEQGSLALVVDNPLAEQLRPE